MKGSLYWYMISFKVSKQMDIKSYLTSININKVKSIEFINFVVIQNKIK